MANHNFITNDVVNLMMKINQVNKSERIAELTSACSDPPMKFHCTVNSAREAMAALFVMVTVTNERAGFARMSFTDHLAKMCYNYNYTGNWATVQEILQLRTMTPYNVGAILLDKMSKEDFYGNFVPLCVSITKNIKAIKVFTERKSRVRKPQRKRGYDDKGSLRPLHKWLPRDVHLGANPDRDDKRALSYTPRTSLHWFNEILKRRNHLE